jgi:SDR family mycofactocin-dependent oxidoreductase
VAGRLQEKVALITGAARGQGRAHAIRLAEEGADIIATDLRGPDEDEAFAETVDAVERTGRSIVARRGDVRDPTEMRGIAEAGVERFGRLDIVVANAGVVHVKPSLDVDPDLWRLTIDVNLSGAFYTAQAALPHMIAGRRGGSIVITSSTMGLKAGGSIAAYVASKHGCVGLMKALAVEFAPHMIRVNTVHPTTVDTPMLESIYPAGMNREQAAALYTKVNALPVPWVEPVDVSNAIVFLASDEGRYVTGTALPVDAGALIASPSGSVETAHGVRN